MSQAFFKDFSAADVPLPGSQVLGDAGFVVAPRAALTLPAQAELLAIANNIPLSNGYVRFKPGMKEVLLMMSNVYLATPSFDLPPGTGNRILAEDLLVSAAENTRMKLDDHINHLPMVAHAINVAGLKALRDKAKRTTKMVDLPEAALRALHFRYPVRLFAFNLCFLICNLVTVIIIIAGFLFRWRRGRRVPSLCC